MQVDFLLVYCTFTMDLDTRTGPNNFFFNVPLYMYWYVGT